jgi:hypothetical protein
VYLHTDVQSVCEGVSTSVLCSLYMCVFVSVNEFVCGRGFCECLRVCECAPMFVCVCVQEDMSLWMHVCVYTWMYFCACVCGHMAVSHTMTVPSLLQVLHTPLSTRPAQGTSICSLCLWHLTSRSPMGMDPVCQVPTRPCDRKSTSILRTATPSPVGMEGCSLRENSTCSRVSTGFHVF